MFYNTEFQRRENKYDSQLLELIMFKNIMII